MNTDYEFELSLITLCKKRSKIKFSNLLFSEITSNKGYQLIRKRRTQKSFSLQRYDCAVLCFKDQSKYGFRKNQGEHTVNHDLASFNSVNLF